MPNCFWDFIFLLNQFCYLIFYLNNGFGSAEQEKKLISLVEIHLKKCYREIVRLSTEVKLPSVSSESSSSLEIKIWQLIFETFQFQSTDGIDPKNAHTRSLAHQKLFLPTRKCLRTIRNIRTRIYLIDCGFLFDFLWICCEFLRKLKVFA